MEYVAAGGSRPTIGVWPPIDHPANSPARTTPRSVIMSMRGSEPCTPPTMEALKAVKYATPLAAMPNIDVEVEGAPLRFRTMADLLGAAPQQDAPDTQLREELLAVISDEPNTVEVAMKSKAWHAAMMDELGSIRENKTWSLADLPRGHKVISLKWVFKLKHDEH
jgi:hypothetical protein